MKNVSATDRRLFVVVVVLAAVFLFFFVFFCSVNEKFKYCLRRSLVRNQTDRATQRCPSSGKSIEISFERKEDNTHISFHIFMSNNTCLIIFSIIYTMFKTVQNLSSIS